MAAESSFKSKLPLVLMISSLICGILFALTHHLFYAGLDGRIVHNQDEQEWNIRIGTGLAFLVKLCLATAAGISYTQILWSTLKQKHLKLDTIDAMFSLPRSIADFICLEIWREAFFLVLVGTLIWILPLVAVFTPGALTVKTAPTSQTNMTEMAKPAMNFTSTQTFAHFTRRPVGIGHDPSNAFARLVSTVYSQGRIQPLVAPFPNSEYDLDFYAPSVSCEPMSGSESFINKYDVLLEQIRGGNPFTFIAFVPDPKVADVSVNKSAVESMILSAINNTLSSGNKIIPAAVDTISKDYARLLFYTYPADRTVNASKATLECGFFNSSYQTTIRFDNNRQTVSFRNITRQNNIAYNRNAMDKDTVDIYDFFAQSYLAAFAGPLVGSVLYSHYGASSQMHTTVFSTVLMQSRELNSGQPDSQPLGPHDQFIIGNISLAEAVEQLSHNVSVSMFSDSHFLSHDEVSENIPVKAWGPQLEYTYNPRNVYIAYCVGVAITSVAVVAGLVCIRRSSLTYGTSFSTILRTTRAMDMDRIITAADSTGAEPLSSRLAETRLQFRACKTSKGSDEFKGGMAFQIDDDASPLNSS